MIRCLVVDYSQQLHLQVGDRDGDVHVGVEDVRSDSVGRSMNQVEERAIEREVPT